MAKKQEQAFNMIIFHRIIDLQAFAKKNLSVWSRSGFVPTMGALHFGHLSLVEKSKNESDITIASIFINPTQFNDPKDFEKYPVSLSGDIQMLEKAGCNILFLPSISEIYPEGLSFSNYYPLGTLETLLEGVYRPGHFQGVCRVVHKLLDIVKPASLFMGEKDFQQCMVVQRLIELEKMPVTLIKCPTSREKDGLAMSSRNKRLSEKERKIAGYIFKEMQDIKAGKKNIPPRELEANAKINLLSVGFSAVDYVSICDPLTLKPLDELNENTPAVVLVAGFLGETRLIDNLRLS